MKKTLIAICTTFTLAISNAGAQSIQEGMNHLYADRFRNAEQTFQKLLSVNPNNAEATYWLGQTYLDMDDNDKARQLYDKALAANGNVPLIMVGKGHVNLLDGKLDDARQMFESALTISRSRKGDDPDILNAIGRANVDAKQGNPAYAVEKLKAALERDPKNANIALNLGNAFRKRDLGQGGDAYQNYVLATQLDPKFAYPYVRIAKLFETQKQWDLVLENLNKALDIDPNFSLALYEMFYYYFFKLDYEKATSIFNRYAASRAGEDKTEDDYLQSQLCWAKKDYDCAIAKAESVKAEMGVRVKPKAYKQLAYSYSGKGEFAKAKTNIDEYFARTKDAPEPQDYVLKAEVYAGNGASCEDIYGIYMNAAMSDTVQQTKLETLQRAADFFKGKGCKVQEADMRMAWFNARGDANPTYLVNFGILYVQANAYDKADSTFQQYIKLAPDSIYGYYWVGRVSYMIDTTMSVEPYITNLLNANEKAIDIALTDKERYKGIGTNAALMLTGYWNNIRSSRDSAVIYLNKGLEIDSTNQQLKGIKEIFDKQAQGGKGTPSSKTGTKPSAIVRKSEAKLT